MLFLFGTDPGQCAELRDVLQARISDTTFTVTPARIPRPKESDTVIISDEEYR